MKWMVGGLVALLALSGCTESTDESATPDSVGVDDAIRPAVESQESLEPVLIQHEATLSHAGGLRQGPCVYRDGMASCGGPAGEGERWLWLPDDLGSLGIVDFDDVALTLTWTDSIPDGGASMSLEIWEVDPQGKGINQLYRDTSQSPMSVNFEAGDWTPGNSLWFAFYPYQAWVGDANIEVGRGQQFQLDGTMMVTTDQA